MQSAANGGFEVRITVDQNLAYQQNPNALPIAVLILIASRNKCEFLAPLAPQALTALENIRAGEVVRI